MEDAYVKMLIDERTKLDISSRTLCEGICSEDMYYKVESGKSSMDRISIKRLLSRLGIDNGDYEHYIAASDYETWTKRMKLINCVEDGDIEKAKKLLKEYSDNLDDKRSKVKNTSRINIEEQFKQFMKLQIMRIENKKEYEENAKQLYEKAVKMTVPRIDEKALDKFVLSPLEMNLVLEYKSRMVKDKSYIDKINIYRELLEYITNVRFGKLFQTKIYAKLVVYMYRDLSIHAQSMSGEELKHVYEEMLKYCEHGFEILRQRKSMIYMLELLEVRENILSWLIENTIEEETVGTYVELKKQTSMYINEIKDIYYSYNMKPYMTNDCYFYRESGIYCINEVAKNRREMLKLTQEKMADEDLSVLTIKRLESMNMNVSTNKFKKIFDKLSLYPSYVNMGVITDKKEAVALYEELRFAITRFDYENVERIIGSLREILSEHRLNIQVIGSTECLNEWRQGKISNEQYIDKLISLLELTISLENIRSSKKIFLTTEELTILLSISIAYKEMKKYDKAQEYISELAEYMKQIEEQNLVDGRMGIYEMVMDYIASLYGDTEKYDASNEISHKLIKMALKLRRSSQIHYSIYNIAWNNHERKMDGIDYHAEISKCIIFSQLCEDASSEIFYTRKFTEW